MSKMRLDAVKVLSGLALTLVILASFDGVVSAQNLVQNPGFEQGSAGWGGGQVVAASPHKGLACLLVNDDKADTSVAASTQKTLPVTQGQGYRFSVWVRAEKAGQKTLLTLNQVDGADKWISGSNMDFVFSSGTTWSEFHVVLRSFHPNAAAVRVTLRPVKWTSAGELTGKAWFDDVALSKVSVSDTTFGAWIRKTGKTRVWVAPVEQKVSPDAVLSTSSPDLQEIHLEAARGEYQPFQIVLDPQVAETLTSVLVSDARDKTTGATLPSAAWTARRVAFLKVTRPTDWGSKTGWRPDPLPLFKGPLSLEAHKAQPLWLTLAVPQNATPGNYTATLTLSFQATGVVTLPLVVKVWGFSMPKTHHLRTAYGLSMPAIDTYHHLGGDKTKRRDVFRRYLKDFAAHRISPYNPMGDAGFSVSFPGWNWGGGAIVVDPAAPTGGNHVLEINDTRTDSAMSATTEVFPIDKTKTHTLSWRVRTDGAHSYLVNVKQFDASGSWISGANIDYLKNGSGTWQTQTVTVQASAFRTQTTSVRISLYARAWTSSGELIGKTFFDDISMVKTGDTKNLVSNGDLEISPSQLQAKVDFSAFDAAATYALDTLGFDSFRLPLSGFGWGDISGTHPGRILTFEWGTKAYEDIFCSEVKAITDHLAKKGWLNRAYVYWMDEPRPADYDFVNYGMDLIHRCDPRLARLLTEQAEAKLIGHVDIWVPILNEYGPVWAHDRQAHGDAVWWYVCTGPKSPYPTNFIDHPGIEHRVRFWMAWQYGVQGSLYWATNYWSSRIAYPPPKMQDPWTDPMSYSSQNGYWGNGDGRLIYPPEAWADGKERIEGPVPSIRWELLREGIEDYEYLWMLQDAQGRLKARGLRQDLVDRATPLLKVPKTIFVSLTEFNADPAVLHGHRHAVGVLLDEMNGVLSGIGGDDAGSGDGAPGDGKVSVSDGAGVAGDGAPKRDGGGRVDGGALDPEASSGCSCRVRSRDAGVDMLWILVGLFLVARRRRGGRRL